LKWKRLSKKKILVLVTLLTLVVFGVSGVYALVTPTLRLTASVAKTRFQIGEVVKITITLQNIGLWPITFTYRQPLFDFVVYDEASKEIFRWGNVSLIELWVNPITLWPTQTTTKVLTWNQEKYTNGNFCPVSKGTYTIATLTRVVHQNRDLLLTTQPIMVTIE